MEQQENDDGVSEVKPYLIRAIHEWCTDNGFTPYLSVVVDARTRVPREFVKDGQIVLNLGLDATHQLTMGNDLITFQARFGGVAQGLSVPMDNVTAIYARENGQGMAFEVNLPDEITNDVTTLREVDVASDSVVEDDSSISSQAVRKGPSHLTRIK